jgi:hypothetical protein
MYVLWRQKAMTNVTNMGVEKMSERKFTREDFELIKNTFDNHSIRLNCLFAILLPTTIIAFYCFFVLMFDGAKP